MKEISRKFPSPAVSLQDPSDPPSQSHSSSSVIHRDTLRICDLIGNFETGFIMIHDQGVIYLVDQHAASEKSLFLQYMIQPWLRYPTPCNCLVDVPNIYNQLLIDKEDHLNTIGWRYQRIQQKAMYTQYRLIEAPQLFGKLLDEQDFLYLLEKTYDGENESAYSNNERKVMATYACHSAIKVGDDMQKGQMRELLQSLFIMDAPFHCPHGRPIMVSLGNISKHIDRITYQKQYEL